MKTCGVRTHGAPHNEEERSAPQAREISALHRGSASVHLSEQVESLENPPPNRCLQTHSLLDPLHESPSSTTTTTTAADSQSHSPALVRRIYCKELGELAVPHKPPSSHPSWGSNTLNGLGALSRTPANPLYLLSYCRPTFIAIAILALSWNRNTAKG
ncbi:unnamed protein product [Boreogadus saida]